MTLATRTAETPNQSSRNGAAVEYIVLHHMATTGFEAVLRSWMSGKKQGSCHYAISNTGEIVEVVPEHLRAWSLSSATFDGKSITFEIANESAGGSWPVSRNAHEATAQVVADLCRRYEIPCNRDRIIGHREVFTRHHAGYATACPGGLNLDGIVARAAELLGDAEPAAVISTASFSRPLAAAEPSEAWAFNTPDFRRQARVQAALKGMGRYSGPVDGIWGSNTIKGIQVTAGQAGYTGPVDGIPGPSTCHFVQVYAARFGDYTGPVDSILGPYSWDGFALGLERK